MKLSTHQIGMVLAIAGLIAFALTITGAGEYIVTYGTAICGACG